VGEDGAPDDLLSQLVAAPTAPRKVTGDQALRVMQMARQTGVVPAVDYANLVSSSPRGPGGVLGYMAAAGYGVQNMPSYLPPAGGVAPTKVGSGQMDDDQEETTGGLTAGLAATAGAQQSAPAAQPTMSPEDLIRQRMALGVQQQAAIQSVYDTTAAQLQQQRQRAQGGLNASDLFKLAGAFATPTRNSSFMGALANVNPVLADITQARETVAQNYPTQLAALRQKYLLDTLAAQAGTLKDVTSPVEKIAQLNKPTPLRSLLAVGSETRDPITGELYTPPNAAAWGALKSSPTLENYKSFVRQFPRSATQAQTLLANLGVKVGGI
jgi:hypothetical protein